MQFTTSLESGISFSLTDIPAEDIDSYVIAANAIDGLTVTSSSPHTPCVVTCTETYLTPAITKLKESLATFQSWFTG